MGERVGSALIAVVPVKSLAEAKSRLAGVMPPEKRSELSCRLLARTLRVLARSRGIDRVAVISRDQKVLELARKFRAWIMWESGVGLNEALEQATRVAIANGAGALLILPADLPRVTHGDVEQIVALGRQAPCLVLAPDEREQGTNALLVNPPGLIRYAFGPGSFQQHRLRGEQAGAPVVLYRSEGLTLDLDWPEDLARLGLQLST